MKNSKLIPEFIFFLFVLISSSCKKETIFIKNLKDENRVEIADIINWEKNTYSKYKDAPKIYYPSFQKTTLNNVEYGRIGIKGSDGKLYFYKDNGILYVEFIRVIPKSRPITYPFSGYYEFVNFDNYSYKQVHFVDGIRKDEKKIIILTESIAPKTEALQGTQTNSWFGQLLRCIANFIIAVPARTSEGWTHCWTLGGENDNDSGSPVELEPSNDDVSTGNLTNFFQIINPPIAGPNVNWPIWTGGHGYFSPNLFTYDPNTPFRDVFFPVYSDDDPIINNGIEVDDIVNEPINSRKIAKTSPRRDTSLGTPEDLQFGTNGNTAGILPVNLLTASDSDLFYQMQELFSWCTFFDQELRTVGALMIERFSNNIGGQFTSSILNLKVSKSSSLINFLKKFGELLNTSLLNAGGNINNVSEINLQNTRPVFNGLRNKFHGLQILINDTEKTEIDLDNFTIDASGNWIAEVTVTIYDHFGLDKNDALTYQSYHDGFSAWWLLQHTRGYKPFETKIVVRKRVFGKI